MLHRSIRLLAPLLALVAACDDPAPLLESLSPAAGSSAGGETVELVGGNFVEGAQVLFGEVPAASVRRVDDAHLSVTTPAHAAGLVDVIVENPGGKRATLPLAYTFRQQRTARPGCRSFSQLRPQGCSAPKITFALDLSTVGRQSANEVLLNGEFNSWGANPLRMQRKSDGTWSADVALLPGEHEYKFVVDGTWFADPKAPSEPIFGNSLRRVIDPCLPQVRIDQPQLGSVIESGPTHLRATLTSQRKIASSDVIVCVDDEERTVSIDSGSGQITTDLDLGEGSHRIAIQAKDEGGFTSAVAWTLVTVDQKSEPPVARPGPTQFVRTGQPFLLDGAGSFDPDASGITSWSWRSVSTPVTFDANALPDARVSSAEGYRTGSNDDPNALPPTTPARKSYTPTLPGIYTFSLEVSDGTHTSTNTDNVTQVVVLPATGPRPRVQLAMALQPDGSVRLDATGSQRSDRATFRWLADAQNPGLIDVSTAKDGLLTIPRRQLAEGASRVYVWIEDGGGASWPGGAQITVRDGAVRVDDAFLAPAWSRERVIHEIFVRRFRDSDGDGVGDLKGVTEKLDYLKSLGIGTLWLMPIFVSNDRQHGYHTTDYLDVDPDLGTREDLLTLIREAHKRDLKIVLDLVINHTSRRHPFFTNALQSVRDPQSTSPGRFFRDWFVWFDNGKQELLQRYGFGRELGGTRLGVDTGWAEIPDVNFSHPAARRYFVDAAKYWADPNGDGDFSDGIDGWRLDHVTGPEHVVWNALRTELKALNPDLLLLAEIFRDFDNDNRGYGIKDYLRGEVDAAFAFPFYWDFEEIWANGQSPARLRETVEKVQSDRFPLGTMHAIFLENHDVPTGTTAFNRYGEAKLMAALTLQAALPGVPQSIWGQELGSTEFRGWVPWQKETPENKLLSHFRSVMTAWRDTPALRTGAFQWLATGNERVVAISRTRAGAPSVLAFVNTTNSSQSGSVDVAGAKSVRALAGVPPSLEGQGRVSVALPAYGSALAEVQ